jgi:cytochrome c oxidase cbb3-type subunit III
MSTKEENKLERDQLTGDEILAHDYDGIRELDNKLPKWWLGLFYFTIIWAAIYMLHYFVLQTGDLQIAEYKNELATAKQMHPASAANNKTATLSLMTDEFNLAEGKVIYDKNCAVCHLVKGEGLVGPNLTDEFWIHGGSLEDVIDIIVVGVPSKGMISWKAQLSPKQIQQVSSFILSLQGTNPPNPKEAQGKLYVAQEKL